MAFEAKGILSFSADTSKAEESMRQFEGNLKSAFRRTGDIRATAALEGFITNLTSGNVMGAIESIGRRLAGFGVLAGAAFGAAAYAATEGMKQVKEFEKALTDSEKVLTRMPEVGAGFDKIKGHIDELIKTTEKTKEPGFLGKAWLAVGSIGATKKEDTLEGAQARAARDHNEAIGQTIRSLEMEGSKSQEVLVQQQEIAKAGERIAEIHAVQRDRLDEVVKKHLTQAETLKLIAAINDSARKQEQAARLEQTVELAKNIRARTGVSMDELLSAGQLAPNAGFQLQHRQNVPVALQGDAYMAKIAQGQLAEGERLRRLGFRDESAIYMREGERIKSEIGGLKENEKMPEYMFKNAIDSASVFKEILGALHDVNGSVRGISFKNAG